MRTAQCDYQGAPMVQKSSGMKTKLYQGEKAGNKLQPNTVNPYKDLEGKRREDSGRAAIMRVALGRV